VPGRNIPIETGVSNENISYSNVNLGLINHGLIRGVLGYSSNSHFIQYLNGTPQLNSRLGFMNPGFIVGNIWIAMFDYQKVGIFVDLTDAWTIYLHKHRMSIYVICHPINPEVNVERRVD
jgi:hypothetical protein